MRRQNQLAVCLYLAASCMACERERRGFRDTPAAAPDTVAILSDLRPGNSSPPTQLRGPYRFNAYGIAEGKRLFSNFNCVGCHANGGGGMGPPLMDSFWIYGEEPENIFKTIVEGRPNGMPSFMGKVPDHQVWQLVAYVRSLSGLVPDDAAPGRSDHMSVKEPEMRKEEERPAEPAP